MAKTDSKPKLIKGTKTTVPASGSPVVKPGNNKPRKKGSMR